MPPEAAWHVRIRGPESDVVVGAGVLIDSRHILTCAHVITNALGRDKASEAPVEAVRIDFPQCAREDNRMARVIAGGWFPEHQSADIAVLEVDGDDIVHAVPAPLRPALNPEDQTVYALGHPAGYDNGIWARARLIARGGVNPEWVQMEAFSNIGKRIQKGYSGAGVWDEQKRAVIGCVIAADRAEPDRVAWMIPLEIVARYWPDLEGLFQENVRHGRLQQGRGRLSLSSIHRIVSAMLSAEELSEATALHSFILLLPAEIRSAVRYAPQPRAYLINLVRTCESFMGGRTALIDALSLFLNNPSERDNLLEVLDREWPPSPE
jgi:S1-C subfamily serine protease